VLDEIDLIKTIHWLAPMTLYVHLCLLLYVASAGIMRLPNTGKLQDVADNQEGPGGASNRRHTF
jgi:hypothetical protein